MKKTDKKRLRWAAALFSMVLVFGFVLGGCSQPTQAGSGTPASSTPAVSAPASGPETRTVTDMVGREIQVPAAITKIGYNANHPTTLTVLGAEALTCVAGEDSFQFFERFDERFSGIEYLAFSGNPDVETILSADPDIFFLRATSAEDERIAPLVEAGITVYVDFGHTADGIVPHVKSVAEALGAQQYLDAAEKYEEYFYGVRDGILEKTEVLGDEERPSVLLFWPREDGTYGATSSNHITGESVAVAGGTVVGEFDAPTDVNVEQVIEWNPDVMIVMDTKEYYDDVISRPELQNVNAVKNGRVYCQPTFIQMPFTEEFPVFQRWLAKTLHPDLFQDVDFKTDIKTFAADFYHMELPDAFLNDMEQGIAIPFKD